MSFSLPIWLVFFLTTAIISYIPRAFPEFPPTIRRRGIFLWPYYRAASSALSLVYLALIAHNRHGHQIQYDYDVDGHHCPDIFELSQGIRRHPPLPPFLDTSQSDMCQQQDHVAIDWLLLVAAMMKLLG